MMNGMKNVKLEPLIVGMDANGPLMADGYGYGLIDWLIGSCRADFFELGTEGKGREGMSDGLI